MNYKNILIRLHTKFPQFDTDTLIEILNCMEESYCPLPISTPAPVINPGISWANDSVLLGGSQINYGSQVVCKVADAMKTEINTEAINHINKAEALN